MRWTFRALGIVPLLLLPLACAPPAAAPSAPAPAAAQSAPAGSSGASAPAAPATKPEPVTINYAHPVISSQYWHSFVGKEKGLFADEGINLDMIFVQAGNPAIAQGTVGGAYELASNSGDVLITAVEQGAALAMLAGESEKAVFGIMVQPEITSFADFKGKELVIGAASVRGGTSTVFRAVLRAQGLQEGPDFSFVAAGSTSERMAALRNKTIAAGLMGQPQDFMMQDEGLRSLGLTTDYLPYYAMSGVTARRDWAQANEDVVLRFLRAHIRSIQWLYDPANRAEAVAILEQATKTERRFAERTYELQVEKVKMWTPNAEINNAAIEGTIKVLLDEGELSAPAPPASKYVDTRYWEKAIAAVGRK